MNYNRLFAANVTALVGTGVAVVAVALIAFEIAGGDAGVVFGTALSIKMVAFILGAPLAAALVGVVPRPALVLGLNVARTAILILVPFVGSAAALYAIVATFTLSSAALAALYQESVAVLLPEATEYSWALVKARAAYDLEGAVSPLIVTLLLFVISPRAVALVAAGLLAFAAVMTTRVVVPSIEPARPASAWRRATEGVGAIAMEPRLRGIPFLALAVASAAAMVTVNTVVLVQGELGLGPRATTVALAAFGFGSVLGALAVPRLVARRPERTLMLAGTGLATAGLVVAAFVSTYATLLATWVVIGIGASVAQLPASYAIRRFAPRDGYRAMFAGLMTITYAAYFAAYQIAGRVGEAAGLDAAFVVLGLIAVASALTAARLWPVLDAPEDTAAHTGRGSGA